MKKILMGFALLIMVGFPLYFIFAHDVTRVHSNQPASNIGARYDERWDAAEFLFTQGEAGRLVFRQASSLPSSAGTVAIEPQSNGTIIPGATLAQDFVVTKWNTTGHIHFTESGL